jgi:hypothetical protein
MTGDPVRKASWTAPSHYNLLMGLMPHSRPTMVCASEYYKKDFVKYSEPAGPCQHRRITITADHGEVFGEDGYVGHGPVLHEKVYEVPFIEGKLR